MPSLLAETLPEGSQGPSRPKPPDVAKRWAAMHAWGDKNLTGRRLEYYRSFVEREAYARMRGDTLRRAKGTVDPWNMATPDEVAESVHYYAVPLKGDDERLWDVLCEAMLNEQRLTPALAKAMGENAKTLPSVTPAREARLRAAYRHRFGGGPSVANTRHQQWAKAVNDEFSDSFQDL